MDLTPSERRSFLHSRALRARSALLRWGHALEGAALLLSLAAPASADDAPPPPAERVRITYSLGTDCPAPGEFERELDERLGSGWKASPDELARNVTITATAGAQSSIVAMEYQDSDGRKLSRTVSAGTCSEALAVMAVITAVAIDAQVRATAPSEPSPEASSDPPPRPPQGPAPTPTAAPPVAPPAPAGPIFVHEAGLRLGVARGFGNGAAFAIGAEWGMVSESGFAVRAGAEGRDTGSVPALDGRARYRALTAHTDVCPLRLPLTSYLAVPLCAGVEGGVLWAEGVIAPPSVTFTRASYVGWFALLVTPRLRLTGSRVFAELVPELRVPLTRPVFAFTNPDRRVYGIPGLAVGATLTAGLRFR